MAKLKIRINNIPDREPNEEPATEKQLDFLRHLATFDESFLQTLGKWQASFLIDKVKETKEDLRAGRLPKKRTGCGCVLFLVLLVSLVLWWVVKTKFSDSQPPQTPDEPTTETRTQGSTATQQPALSRGSEPAHKADPEPKPVIEAPAPVEIPSTTLISSFKYVSLPTKITTLEPVKLLDQANKEVNFPANINIRVEDKTAGGTLIMKINGVQYIGHETRLINKTKLIAP